MLFNDGKTTLFKKSLRKLTVYFQNQVWYSDNDMNL